MYFVYVTTVKAVRHVPTRQRRPIASASRVEPTPRAVGSAGVVQLAGTREVSVTDNLAFKQVLVSRWPASIVNCFLFMPISRLQLKVVVVVRRLDVPLNTILVIPGRFLQVT